MGGVSVDLHDLLDRGPSCEVCGSEMDRVRCWNCGGEGFSGHDCGEDCCMCRYPEENVVCDICGGIGGWDRCYSCTPIQPGETD